MVELSEPRESALEQNINSAQVGDWTQDLWLSEPACWPLHQRSSICTLNCKYRNYAKFYFQFFFFESFQIYNITYLLIRFKIFE